MPDDETPDVARDLELILDAGREAGELAMRYFGADPEVWWKNEGTSPVSAGDIAVDGFLKRTLRQARPDYGWLSEETVDAADRLTHDTVFVVDPIDGTRAFIAGKPTWCVSIAVVSNGAPVAGVLVAPALDEVFHAGAGGSTYRNGAVLRIVDEDPGPMTTGLRFAAPKTLVKGLSDEIGRAVETMPHVPSLAYRLAMVASGRLDATLVKPKARDWDVAAADLILKQAGGAVTTIAGEPLIYNRAETDHGVLVAARASMMPDLALTVGRLQRDGENDAAAPKD